MTPEQKWPTPSFDRADFGYECAGCYEVVEPKRGDKQAGVLIAGATRKLCEDCARNALDAVTGGDE